MMVVPPESAHDKPCWLIFITVGLLDVQVPVEPLLKG